MTALNSATPASSTSSSLRQDIGLIGLISLAHGISHFNQLLLAPLFPWLKDAFNVSYTQLGLLLTVFFVVSCAVQALSGFVVDRFGAWPVLVGGLCLLVIAAIGYATAQSYAALMAFAVVAGFGNGVFHPADYTLINRKVDPPRLGHAYSAHGISGSLGWALAPAMLVPIAMTFGWRNALLAAAGLGLGVLLLMTAQRQRLRLPRLQAPTASGAAGTFDFLRIPAVWMCFTFFLFNAGVLSVVQTFAPEAARQLHTVPLALVAVCLTVYMLCSAGGMVFGGFLATDPARCERIVGIGYGIAACLALTCAFAPLPGAAIPVLFGAMGAATGMAGPSRDLLVKRSTPEGATGRVYGVVYAGLDIGQALAPLAFGRLMDLQHYQAIWIGLAALQLVLISTAFNVRRARRVA